MAGLELRGRGQNLEIDAEVGPIQSRARRPLRETFIVQ